MRQILAYERPNHVEERGLPGGPVKSVLLLCLMPAIAPIGLTIVFHWPIWIAIVTAILFIAAATAGAGAVRTFRCVSTVYADRFQVTLCIVSRSFWTRQMIWAELATCQVRPGLADKTRVLSVSPRLVRVMDFDQAVELVTTESIRLQVGSDHPTELVAAINASRSVVESQTS
jgi:hypothetical protein